MKVYYFTRTGRSKSIAEQIAARGGAHVEPITDHKNWEGSLQYAHAAMVAMRGKTLPADYAKPAPGERVAVVFPIWAGGFPPAVKTFVQEVGRENIVAIPTSLGSTLQDRTGFVRVIDLVGKDIAAPEVPE